MAAGPEEEEARPTHGSTRTIPPRRNRRFVLCTDWLARWVITIGGIATIGAILLVAVFLAWVAFPLFRSESLGSAQVNPWRRPASSTSSSRSPRTVSLDEYGELIWTIESTGAVGLFTSMDGRQLALYRPPEEVSVQSVALSGDRQLLALGLADGRIIFASIEFVTDFVSSDEVPEPVRHRVASGPATIPGGLLERSEDGKWRRRVLKVEWQPAVRVRGASSIQALDVSVTSGGRVFAALDADHRLHVGKLTQKKNLLTGEVQWKQTTGTIDVPWNAGSSARWVALTGLGDQALVMWPDGRAHAYDVSRVRTPRFVESFDLVPQDDRHVAAWTFLVGKTSLAVGDSQGDVAVWFRAEKQDVKGGDRRRWVAAHHFPGAGPAVVSLASSLRSRMLAAAYEDGRVGLYHVTSDQRLAEARLFAKGDRPTHVVLAPKDDRLMVVTPKSFALSDIEAPHPEITWSSIFRPVWYEGYAKPEHVWQSSSGSDDFEPKYGLMPLVFGTLKATVYSLIFAVPLALLAAVYTSEFLHPKTRRVVKPTIEIMASLPSVVLGFLAALVFAPAVETWLVSILAGLVIVPWTILLGAYLWQCLPPRRVAAWQKLRLPLVAIAIVAGMLLAHASRSFFEDVFFAGNVRLWLDGQIGSGTAAWFYFILPLAVAAVTWLSATVVTPRLRTWLAHWPVGLFALVDLLKFLLATAATVALAGGVAWLLQNFAWDPRGTIVGTYVQRNALVVGATMGFAVIPIIFTIADDALTAVPQSLRAGSLGAGATTWQTAIRVVVPTAMSGLFSAVIIGLGRAVGETMIVLMAAGNTPIMEWNIFNGFRTLSANIAVELPEAVIGSTHYRMLFVAALLLFAVTFVINTVAEAVRIRFRKRAFQL